MTTEDRIVKCTEIPYVECPSCKRSNPLGTPMGTPLPTEHKCGGCGWKFNPSVARAGIAVQYQCPDCSKRNSLTYTPKVHSCKQCGTLFKLA